MTGIERRTFTPTEIVPRETGIYLPVLTRTREVVVFPKVHLTPREIEVLNLTAQGFSSEEIKQKLSLGKKLPLNLRTIKSYKQHISDAFGTNTMLQSVIMAVNMNILDVSELTKDMDKQALQKLSARELQALENLANGVNPEKTAKSLYVSRETFDAILESARRKLNLEKNPQKRLRDLPAILLYMAVKKQTQGG